MIFHSSVDGYIHVTIVINVMNETAWEKRRKPGAPTGSRSTAAWSTIRRLWWNGQAWPEKQEPVSCAHWEGHTNQNLGENGKHVYGGSRNSFRFCFSYTLLSFQLNSKKMKIEVDYFSPKSTQELFRAIRCGVGHGASVCWVERRVFPLSCFWEVQSRGAQCFTPATSTSHGPTFSMLSGDWGPAQQDRGRAWAPGLHPRWRSCTCGSFKLLRHSCFLLSPGSPSGSTAKMSVLRHPLFLQR